MARRKAPQGLRTHPMLKQIIDAWLEGQSARKIASWCKPSVSHTAIYNYGKSVIDPTMQNAEALKALLPPIEIGNKGFALAETQQLQPEQIGKAALLGAPVLAVRERRIEALQDRHNRLKLIVDERAVDMAEYPGGKSGLLCKDFKGKDADQVVLKVDTGLLAEFREHEKQVAQELGQWQEHNAPSVAIQIVMPAGPAYGHHVEAETIEIATPKR